jgi:hypothetical protein
VSHVEEAITGARHDEWARVVRHSERLRRLILGQRRASDDCHQRPQARIPARLEEVRELGMVLLTAL